MSQIPAPLPVSNPPEGDVALFIDWENFKYSLYEVSRMPNIAALIEAIRQRYGRPVVARAYADWQDYYHRKSFDQMNLYQAGIEPIYVPARRSPFGPERIKNSVDIKMSLDCLEISFTHPQVQTYVLVAGDADFLHVASALRRRGGRVVMIGVSGSTSSRLGAVVDEMVYYDEEIDQAAPSEVVEGDTHNGHAPADKSPAPTTAAGRTMRAPLPETTVEEARALLVRVVREQRESEGGRNYPPLLSWLGLQMRDRAPRFHPEKHGFDRFKDFVFQMQETGLLLIEPQGLVERVWLPEDEAEMPKPAPLAAADAAAQAADAAILAEPDDIPDDYRDDFTDIVLTADDIENSYRDYMAKGLLARFLYNKGHWDPADLPPQAAPPRSDGWRTRELPEIIRLIDIALDKGVLFRNAYVDPYTGNEIPALKLNDSHPFVRKVFARGDARG